MKGDEDTAIIITTGRFSAEAKTEARPGQNLRVVYLIDGNQLVDICKRHEIGVIKKSLPQLLVLDPESQVDSPNGESSADSTALQDSDDLLSVSARRLRDEMLGDADRGLSPQQVADLSGYSLNTVRVYLADPIRRKVLGDRIRSDPDTRTRALGIVSGKRIGK